MNSYLKQSTASQVRTIGPFVDDTDFKTLENALTIANTDIRIKKNGAASAAKNSGGATADGNGGLYAVTWDATDTATVGELSVSVKVAGALVYFCSYVVLEEAVYDAIFNAAAVGYVADQPVNVTKWAGSATATTNIALKTTLAKTTDVTGFNDISAANVQTELTTYGGLKPTTAGRTLDVSATGEAGLDWANIGAPTTAQNLSGTTISTSQVAASVTNPVALTAAYDAAKTAATQTSVNTIDGRLDTEIPAIKTSTDNLATAMELDGAVYRFTVNALEQAPAGGGGGTTDWTAGERDQIRHRLGIDGTTAAPSATPSLAKPGDAMALTSGERTTLTAAIWNALTSGLTTVGSIGKLLVDNINATISSRSTYAGADTSGTTTLLSRIGSALTITAGKVDVNDKTGFALTAAYDAAKTAAAPGAAMTLTPGYDAAKLAAPVGAAMTLTSPYDAAKTASTQTSVDAVKAVVDAVNAAVDTEVGAIKAKTDQLVFTGGRVDANATITLTSTDFNNIADAVLKRDWTLLSGEAAYSLLNAARMLRNKWDTAAGTLTVKKEDSTTTAWTRTLTVDPAAQPIVGAT